MPWQSGVVDVRNGHATPTTNRRPYFSGAPHMNGLARHLADQLDVSYCALVTRLVRRSAWWDAPAWQIVVDDRLQPQVFDQVVLALPPQQASRLLGDAPHWQRRLDGVRMHPRLTAMLRLAEPLPVDWDAARAEDDGIAWAIRQRTASAASGDSWVIHATTELSRERLDRSPRETAWELTRRFARAVGTELPAVDFLDGHRWRYATTATPLGADFLHDASLGLAVCGDWCRGDGVEDAFLSGQALADHMAAAERGSTSVAVAGDAEPGW
jgi:predicted NAD/FAD-dependent oxidoreductase